MPRAIFPKLFGASGRMPTKQRRKKA